MCAARAPQARLPRCRLSALFPGLVVPDTFRAQARRHPAVRPDRPGRALIRRQAVAAVPGRAASYRDCGRAACQAPPRPGSRPGPDRGNGQDQGDRVVAAFHPVGRMPLRVRRGGINGIGEQAEWLIRAFLATSCLARPTGSRSTRLA
jgi:hypothetical protein